MFQVWGAGQYCIQVSKQGNVVRGKESNPSLQRGGFVEGKYVQDILLDTGCFKLKLVPEGRCSQERQP